MDKKQEARYVYTDEANNPLYRQNRYYENGEKKFYSESFVDGKWVKGNKDVEKVLYKLPSVVEAVKKAEKIYWVEGEKDVETLLKKGLVATTIANGAGGKLPQNLTNTLEGANIVILPDNDQVGQEFATKVANSLTGYASTVKILDLTKKWPDLKEKGDITDVFEMINNDDEVLSKLEELEKETGLYTKKTQKEVSKQQKEFTVEELGLELKIPNNFRVSKEKGISTFKTVRKKIVEIYISPIPILISKILENISTGEEKVELVFFKRNKWRNLIVDKNVLYSSQNIITQANKGIPVSSNNNNDLVAWFYELESANLNNANLKIELVTNKMGWVDDKTFVPFRNNDVHLELEEGIKSWLDRIGEKKRNS